MGTMANHEIEVSREAVLDTVSYEPPGQAVGRQHPLLALRYHWLTALVVWLLLTAVAIPGIWLLMKPEYTATAQLKVDPVMSTLLDSEMRTMPLFDSYLASQAHLMSSGRVLTRALADPKVKDLPLLQEPEPVGVLRAKLTVDPIPRTYIVRVSVTHPTQQSAILLADAVLNAYLQLYGGSTEINEKLQFLVRKEAEFRRTLDDLDRRKRTLANEYKASTDSMFEKLRELEANRLEQVQEMIGSLDLRIMETEQEIERLKSGAEVLLDDSTPVQQRQAVENNPLVRSLQDRLSEESDRLVRLRSGLTDEAPAVIDAKAQIETLKQAIEEEKLNAAEEFVREQQLFRGQLMENRLAVLAARLESDRRIKAALDARAQEQQAIDRRMGETNLDIQTAQELIQRTQSDLREVEEARKKLELELSQPGPGRVATASTAEILPDGFNDKRVKLSMAAVVGCLGAAFGAALLRNKLDSRLHVPHQVENETGLRILGVVPAISELRRGRVAEEDFAEAYRLVRVNVLSETMGEPPKSILVTSAWAGEGKTSLAVSLAVSLAELGGRVLLIDGDVQAPQIGKLLQVNGPFRLRDVLSGERGVVQAAVQSRLAHLEVLLGSHNGDVPRGLIDPHTVRRLIQDASSEYEFVVVDSPPALGTADAVIWSQAVDRVVLSTQVGCSDLGATRRLCERLSMVRAHICGAVVCNVTVRHGLSDYSSYSSSVSRNQSRGDDRATPACLLPRLDDDTSKPPVS